MQTLRVKSGLIVRTTKLKIQEQNGVDFHPKSRCRNGHFYSIIVFRTTGSMGIECQMFLKNLAETLARRNGDDYASVLTWIRSILSFKIARRRKQEKYRDLRSQILVPCEKFKVVTEGIRTLGFITKKMRKFPRLCRSLNLQDIRIVAKCMEVALRATFYIFCTRNKNWTCPELLNFYYLLM